ncbi:MAG TPA: ABC transporter permease [Armatimonadota bacterium]|nr:ABC transporter permease [Armatimonadota bacterium]
MREPPIRDEAEMIPEPDTAAPPAPGNGAAPANGSPPASPGKRPGLAWGRMTPLDTFGFAWRAVRDNKLRSALTILGIVIGVAAVVAAVAVGQGAGASITNSVGQLGNNLLYIVPSNPRLGPGAPEGLTQTMRLEDADAILERCSGTVARVAPAVRGSVLAKTGNNNWRSPLQGIVPAHFVVNNVTVANGRQINQADNDARARVAVVGETTVLNLYGSKKYNCVGQEVALNRTRFTIVGILKGKGTSTFGEDQDNVVLIPIQTALTRVLNRRNLDFISVECRSPEMIDLAQEQIIQLLRQRHRLSPPFPDNDDFTVLSQAQLLTILQTVTGVLTALLASIAAISLTVGGIGIMNIMLVSVTERTREIGIRKALGATEANIRSQFLIEAALLSIAGGILGVLFGGGISMIAAKISGWEIAPNLTSVVVAVSVSASIGIFFGYWPARKAAKLHPIEALRRE